MQIYVYIYINKYTYVHLHFRPGGGYKKKTSLFSISEIALLISNCKSKPIKIQSFSNCSPV